MSQLPSISIITNSYNPNLKIFRKSLESIKKQKYPKKLIEHLVDDIGSTNGAVDLAKKYGCKIIKRSDFINTGQFETQERMSLAIKRAKNELILILETDNIMVGNDWLLKMVTPFMGNKKVVSTYSIFNAYEKNMPLLTKYFALFGVNDIFLYYLGKSEKIPLDMKKYDKGEILEEKKDYYLVKFNVNNLPPIGDNGFMVRKKNIDKVNQDSKNFLHTDAFFEMVQKGHDLFGAVKNSMIHYCNGNIWKQYKNRVLMKELFYDNLRNKRNYLTFNPRSKKEIFNLIKFIIFSLTIIMPIMRSLKGYLKKREIAWFLNPVVCFIALITYSYSEFIFLVKKNVFSKFKYEIYD